MLCWAEWENGNIHRPGGEQGAGWAGEIESRLARRGGGTCGNDRRTDLVWRVVDASSPEAAFAVGGKKQVSFDEEELKRAGPGGRSRGAGLPRIVTGGRGRVAPRGVEVHLLPVTVCRHLGVEIGQMEKAPREKYGQGLIAIEGVKPDARPTGLIMDIGPDIELKKPRDPGQRRQPCGAHPLHEEGHDAHVREALESIDLQSAWQR